MRVRNAGAMMRLFLVLVLAAGTILSSLPPSGSPGGWSATQNAVQAEDQKSEKATGKGSAKKADKERNGKKDGKGKQHKGKKAPASLDAERIAARNADAVEALECNGLESIRVGDRTFCTHGDDPQLFGLSGDDEAEPDPSISSRAAGRAVCIDNGVSGPRVQLIYVHKPGEDRLPELLPTFRRLASEMDTIVDQSARKTGGSLRVRFVTNDACQVDIPSLSVPANAMRDFGPLIQELKRAGYDKGNRKYLMLVDASVFCGVGTFLYDDDEGTDAHNFLGYARVDKPCWDPGTMVHELSHTLGAVQYSAPNTSRGAHCIDEWDVMCYSDEPHKPKMKFFCKDGPQDFRLDCQDDDYFATNPAPGSYLEDHWNMAESIYFTGGAGETCVDAALEPDDAFWFDYWEIPMRKFSAGESEARAFCDEGGDTDWMLLEAERGKTYQIETSNLGPDVDTQLVLYRGFLEQHWTGMDQIAFSDDREEGESSSAITFTAPSAGSYLIGVSDAEGRAGLDQTYTFSVQNVAATVSDTLTLSRTRAKPGGSFTATMSDLEPETSVSFFWSMRKGQSIPIGEKTANAEGVATTTYTVPKGADAGLFVVEAFGGGATATANFKVEKEGGQKEQKGKKHKKHGKKGKGGKKGRHRD
jgi:hypothetical protein